MTAHSVLYKALGAFEDPPAMLCRLRDTVLGSTCRPWNSDRKTVLAQQVPLSGPKGEVRAVPQTRSEVFQAVRGMLGLSVQELWLDYVGLGGSLPPLRPEHS
jgi:hypothetical protein